jgi:26S proteasome non-ATPase regulatory subunit 9
MNVIENAIHEHFANQAQQTPESANSSTSRASEGRALPARPVQTLDAAFAKVNTVVPGSPAESAGLMPGDEIRNFGYVNRENNDGLRRVAECVQGNEGHNVIVKISRKVGLENQKQELQLTLTPRRDWGGRGLLGCHILPI